MSETQTRHMTQAKPSEKDISEMYDFFNQWEALQRCSFDPEDHDWCEEWGKISNWKASDSESEEDVMRDFFLHWTDRVGHRWRRVVFGVETLIENCCDPDKDHLAWKPEIKSLMEAAEASQE